MSSAATYTYTARGTLAATVTTAGTQTTQTDAFGQVTRQDATTGQSRTYTYDGLGRLTGDGLSYTGVGNTLASDEATTYTRDPSGAVVGAATATSKSLVWTDQHTDVVAQFTPTGTSLAGAAVYDPWGQTLATTLTGNLGYQSGWTDTATGRVNMASRWYNPATGAFDTRDTANVNPAGDLMGANRYAYASANPMTNLDPTGTWSVRGALKSVANTVSRAATAVVNTVVAVAQAVYTNVIAPVINAVVNAVTAVYNAVTSMVRSAVNWVRSTVSNAVNWVSQKASAARAWVAQQAAAAKQRAAQVVAVARQAAKAEIAKAQRTYAAAKQKLADAYQASATWVADHKNLLIEIAAIGAGIIAGLACTAATAGAGAVACMVGAAALVNLAKDAAQGNINNWGDAFTSFGTGALQGLGGAAGGIVGGKLATLAAAKLGGFGAGLIGRTLIGAVAGGAEDAISQFVSTGRVDLGSVAMSAGIGAVFGARGGRPGARGASDIDAPSAPRRGAGDNGGQSPGRSSGGTDGPEPPTGGRKQAAGDCGGCPCHSFTPDTRVVMADGTTKPLKDIRLGDTVHATDPTTGATSTKQVTALHHNQDTDLTDLTVTTSSGARAVIHTTQKHPSGTRPPAPGSSPPT